MDRIAAADTFRAITPNDAADLPVVPHRGVFVGGAGTLAVVDAGGTSTTFTVPAGTTLPIKPVRVKATGTTATLIVGLS